jgi:CheY-like chemotaxis protein
MTINRTTILVVDDEPLIRDVIVDVLQDEGYGVVTADDWPRCPGAGPPGSGRHSS